MTGASLGVQHLARKQGPSMDLPKGGRQIVEILMKGGWVPDVHLLWSITEPQHLLQECLGILLMSVVIFHIYQTHKSYRTNFKSLIHIVSGFFTN